MADSLFDILGEFGDRYERDNPEWRRITLLQILRGAALNLKKTIENPEIKNITWENSLIELAYPVQANWDKLEPYSFGITAVDQEDPAKLRAAFAQGFITTKEVYVLERLTRGILLIIKDGKGDYKFPPDLDKKLGRLSGEKWDRRKERILKSITRPTRFCFYERSGKKPGRVYLAWRFKPCVLNVDEGRAYFPIVIGLEFRGIKPGDLSEGVRADAWKELLKVIGGAIPKENLDFLEGPRPEPAARSVPKEEIEYPIVKIDRTTEQDLLPLVLHKGIFKNYLSLPTRETLIASEQRRLNKIDLSFDEERAILTKTGQYRWGNAVVRDYGDHAIGFSSQLYLDYIKQAEEILKKAKKDAQKEPYLYDEENKKIEAGLRQVSLYRMAHRLAHLTLAQVYSQRKATDLIIQKEDIIKWLGHTPEEKQIYQDIKESYENLMFCHFQRWNFSYTGTHKKPRQVKEYSKHSIGTFIYNLDDDAKTYTLDVNEKFVGCIASLFQNTLTDRKKRGEVFGRGYYDFPIRVLSLTRHYPLASELLTNFLISEKGNPKLNTQNMKIIAHRGRRYAQVANIRHKRQNVRYRDLLEALEKVEIVENIDPSIEDLRKLKPARGLETVIHVSIQEPIEKLDALIADLAKRQKVIF